LTPDV